MKRANWTFNVGVLLSQTQIGLAMAMLSVYRLPWLLLTALSKNIFDSVYQPDAMDKIDTIGSLDQKTVSEYEWEDNMEDQEESDSTLSK